MTASSPVTQAVRDLQREYDHHLSTDDLKYIVKLVLSDLREPEQATLQLFEEELDEAWGRHPDPSAAEGDRTAQQVLARRLALTYAWRRSIDRLNRMIP